MLERDRDLAYQEKTKQDFERLKTAIQPVLDGDIEKMKILEEEVDPETGGINIQFFPVNGVLGERGKKAFEMLRREIEYTPDYDYFAETGETDDGYHCVEVWNVPTKHVGIILERRELRDKFRAWKEPERIEWSIVNIHPKGKVQRFREKTSRLVSNLLRAPWPN